MITNIETCGTKISYDSDLDVYDYLIKNQQTIELPDIKISRGECGKYIVRYRDSVDKKIKCYNNEIQIFYPKEEINEATVIYPAFALIEKQLFENNMTSFHSACVTKDDAGILLMGKTGSGKTTTAINLCINYDYMLMSNDKTILHSDKDGLVGVNGPKFVFLRYESIKRNIPKLLPVFEGKIVDSNYVHDKTNNIDTWLQKVKVQPSELGIKESANNIPIESAFLLHVDENQKNLVVRNAGNLQSTLYITECLNKMIRALEINVNDKYCRPIGYIDSYDNEKNFEFKQQITNQIIDDLKLIYISGNIKDISDYIDDNHKKMIKKKKEV